MREGGELAREGKMERAAVRTRRSFLVSGALTAFGATVGGLARPWPGATALAAPIAVTDASARAPGSPASAAPAEFLAVADPPLSEADYWQFADWLQPAKGRLLSEAQ